MDFATGQTVAEKIIREIRACGDFSTLEDCQHAVTHVCRNHPSPYFLCDEHAGSHGTWCKKPDMIPAKFYRPLSAKAPKSLR